MSLRNKQRGGGGGGGSTRAVPFVVVVVCFLWRGGGGWGVTNLHRSSTKSGLAEVKANWFTNGMHCKGHSMLQWKRIATLTTSMQLDLQQPKRIQSRNCSEIKRTDNKLLIQSRLTVTCYKGIYWWSDRRNFSITAHHLVPNLSLAG